MSSSNVQVVAGTVATGRDVLDLCGLSVKTREAGIDSVLHTMSTLSRNGGKAIISTNLLTRFPYISSVSAVAKLSPELYSSINEFKNYKLTTALKLLSSEI
jgi:hypothetical protein